MKIKWKNKVYSGALQLTIFISVIIALLLTAVVLLVYTHRYFLDQSKAIIDNINYTDSGISYLKAKDVSVDTLLLPIPEAGEFQSVKANLSHWGIYEKAYVEATHRQKKFIKCSFLGSAFTKEKRPALYLQETFKPIMVVGHTRIEGLSFLPEQGIRPGNISGNSYYGSSLVYGEIKKSATELPNLKYDYKPIFQYYLNEYEPQDSERAIVLKPHSKQVCSFKKPAKGYYSKDPIVLQDITLYGNIIIRSDQKVTITNTADLKDIIIAAPVIEIQDGVKGNFQAIATKTIKAGKNCKLNYPSALILSKCEENTPSTFDPFYNKIFIDNNTIVKGSICYFNEIKDGNTNYLTNVFIEKETEVHGEVYCKGNLELRGEVSGSVFTSQFVTNEGGTIFVNHLYDALIISKDLPEAFGGIVFENEPKSVMKWLY